jgi:beta-galactosidase
MHTSLLDGRILITQATVLPHTDGFTLLSLGKNKMDYILYPSRDGWKPQHVEVDSVNVPAESRAIGGRRLAVRIQQPEKPQVNEYFLKINYVADVAMAFINGTMVLDQFYHGAPWLIGLKRFSQPLQATGEMNFYFRPLSKNASFLNDLPPSARPDFSQQNKLLHIDRIEIIPEYKVRIRY